jgi:hypothetical protein
MVGLVYKNHEFESRCVVCKCVPFVLFTLNRETHLNFRGGLLVGDALCFRGGLLVGDALGFFGGLLVGDALGFCGGLLVGDALRKVCEQKRLM